MPNIFSDSGPVAAPSAVTHKEAANALGLSTEQVARLATVGLLPTVSRGRTFGVSAPAVESLLARPVLELRASVGEFHGIAVDAQALTKDKDGLGGRKQKGWSAQPPAPEDAWTGYYDLPQELAQQTVGRTLVVHIAGVVVEVRRIAGVRQVTPRRGPALIGFDVEPATPEALQRFESTRLTVDPKGTWRRILL